jgi:DNA-binding transcriptional ArsR family regulator
MSFRTHKRAPAVPRLQAPVFAALGDETRLKLLLKLAHGKPVSLTQLSLGATITRQAISKHLRVLENAGMVQHTRAGRESHFALNPKPLDEAQAYLQTISKQWEETMLRLKMFVEWDTPG